MENKTYELSPVGQQEKQFALIQRQAAAYNCSTMVPAQYRGQEHLGDAVIAVELAHRMGVSPLAVMQNLHVIQGRPSWAGSFLIAAVNATGNFTPLKFETKGEPMQKGWGVRAYANEILPDGTIGERLYGTWVTTEMVVGEKWNAKPGSKWLTMPAHMGMLRAGAMFARVYAPQISMGMLSKEEAEDIAPTRNVVDGGYAEEVKVSFAAPQPQEAPQPEQAPAAAPKAAQKPEDLFK